MWLALSTCEMETITCCELKLLSRFIVTGTCEVPLKDFVAALNVPLDGTDMGRLPVEMSGRFCCTNCVTYAFNPSH